MRFLFSPYGRVSRKTYWLNWIIPYFIIAIGAVFLDFATFPVNPETGEPPPIFQLVSMLLLFWPSLAVMTKRLHDRGMTGWWQAAPLLLTVPLAVAAYWYYTAKMRAADTTTNLAVVDPNITAVVVVAFAAVGAWIVLYPLVNALFLRGQAGPNKYGDDPLGGDTAETFS